MSAPRVVVVSLRKSGTHLVRELVSALGYTCNGEVSLDPVGRTPLPKVTAWRIVRMMYTVDEIRALDTCNDRAAVDEAVARAILALNRVWLTRLGVRWISGNRPDDATEALADRALRDPATRRFDNTPAGQCWFLHQLDLDRIDESFLAEWLATDEPRIILNYRDPRDVLLSMVNFLTAGTPKQLGLFGDHRVYAEILRTANTLDERITMALTDPSFPGANAFERALWLYRHPRTCSISFEELVGPRGGGSTQAQTAAIRRVIEFLDAPGDPEAISHKIFNPESQTFHRGQIGQWREHFSTEHLALCEARLGAMIKMFGYCDPPG